MIEKDEEIKQIYFLFEETIYLLNGYMITQNRVFPLEGKQINYNVLPTIIHFCMI